MDRHILLKSCIVISVITTSCLSIKNKKKTMTNDYNKLDTFSKKFERVHWREPLSHMDSLSFMKNKIEDMISILYYFEQNKFPKDEVRDSIYNLKLPFDTIRYYKLYDEFNKAGRTFKE